MLEKKPPFSAHNCLIVKLCWSRKQSCKEKKKRPSSSLIAVHCSVLPNISIIIPRKIRATLAKVDTKQRSRPSKTVSQYKRTGCLVEDILDTVGSHNTCTSCTEGAFSVFQMASSAIQKNNYKQMFRLVKSFSESSLVVWMPLCYWHHLGNGCFSFIMSETKLESGRRWLLRHLWHDQWKKCLIPFSGKWKYEKP